MSGGGANVGSDHPPHDAALDLRDEDPLRGRIDRFAASSRNDRGLRGIAAHDVKRPLQMATVDGAVGAFRSFMTDEANDKLAPAHPWPPEAEAISKRRLFVCPKIRTSADVVGHLMGRLGSEAHRPARRRPARTGAGSDSRGGSLTKARTILQARG